MCKIRIYLLQGAYGTYESGLHAQLLKKRPISDMPVHGSFSPGRYKKKFIRENFFIYASRESILLYVLFGFVLASKLADLEIK